MRIVGLVAYPMRCDLHEPFAYSQKWFQGRTGMLVKVTTDAGIEGWGEIFCHDAWPALVPLVERVYRPLVVGADPLDIAVIWHRLYGWTRDYGQKGLTTAAISGIDIALWDILGKHAQLPLYKLLGGAFCRRVKAYATGLYLTEAAINDPAPLVDEALEYVEAGFDAIKMKVGFGLRADTAAIAAVRAAIGPRVDLMVDANHAYDVASAIQLGRVLEEHNVAWFEEPVVPEDVDGYAAVRAALDVPIAGGEAEFTSFGFQRLLARRAVDIAQPDICITGGISETHRIAVLAQASSVRCVPHVWGTGVAIAAALHFIAALPPQPPSLYGSLPHLLELDRTENPIRDNILKTPIDIQDGYARVPDGPGLGIEVDEEVVARYLVS